MKLNKILLFAFCLASFHLVYAQNSKDSLLINERTLDRPLNVHGGQLRISGSYEYTYFSKQYDENGQRTDLKPLGLSYGSNGVSIDILYGITEHLELGINLSQENSLIRERSVQLIGFPDETATLINTTHKYSGLNDLEVEIDYRLPFKTRKLDLLLKSGVSAPISNNGEQQPNYSFEDLGDYWLMSLRNNYGNGKGVPSVKLGGEFKYRLKNLGFTVIAYKQIILRESTGQKWESEIQEDNSFTYTPSDFVYKIRDFTFVSLTTEVQASPFFNIFIDANYSLQDNGWFYENSDAIRTPDQSLITMGGGFELIVTPKIWLRETISYPVIGESIDSGLQFRTSLQYNLFVKQ